jgi:hypothetical protein
MAEERKPTTFWQHFQAARRRAFQNFQWTRDILLGLVLGVSSILLQAHWGLIVVKDWQEHWGRWILSIVIPYGSARRFSFDSGSSWTVPPFQTWRSAT